MNLAEKLHTSVALMKTSWRVIRNQPRLAIFPALSTAGALVCAAFFFAPLLLLVAAQAGAQAWMARHGWNLPAPAEMREVGRLVFSAYGAVVYLVSLLVSTFVQAAFYHQILRALAGAPVSVADGLAFAVKRLPAIILWSLLAGTVGLIIRAIEERLGWLGKLVLAALGTIWSVAAVFAIPVLLRREDSNPLAVLRDSALTLKRTWGESCAGFLGIQLAGGLLVAAALGGAVVVAVVALGAHSLWLAVFLGGGWLLAVLGAAFLLHQATHVYRCALYVYASEGVVPEPFTAAMMNAGWKVRSP